MRKRRQITARYSWDERVPSTINQASALTILLFETMRAELFALNSLPWSQGYITLKFFSKTYRRNPLLQDDKKQT